MGGKGDPSGIVQKLNYVQIKMRAIKLSETFVGFVEFYGISTIVGYLMPNPLYTNILSIYDLVWFDFMPYQPLYVI